MHDETFKIVDVAKKLGVSPSTVSRVLNNRPGVGEELRQQVKDFIEEVGYKPNVLASSLKKNHINVIGLVFADVRNPFYAELSFYIQKYLNDLGYMVMTFNSEYSDEKELQYIELAHQYKFSGLMLTNVHSTERIKKMLESSTLPVVLVNRTLDVSTCDAVLLDNFQAGYLATKHLIDLGHKDAAFLFGHRDSSPVYRRFLGYQELLKSRFIPLNESHVFYGDQLNLESGLNLASEYLARIDSLPSAVVASNDFTAFGFIDGLLKQGVRVPDDISVVSFDNTPFSALRQIDLTSVDPQTQLMSEHAVQLMLERIKNPSLPGRRILLDPKLMLRKSTAAPD